MIKLDITWAHCIASAWIFFTASVSLPATIRQVFGDTNKAVCSNSKESVIIIKVLIRPGQDFAAIKLLTERILTKEPDYLVVEVTQDNLVRLRSQGFQVESPRGEDYVLRILKVSVHSREDVERIVEMGFDVPEVRTDYVIAIGYDWQIEKLKQQNFAFESIRRNDNFK